MRLIDADALKQQFEIWDEDDEVAVWSIMNEINSAPTIEPERKKGKWILHETMNDRYDDMICPFCRKSYTVDAYRIDDIGFTAEDFNFCPNCGADMRGGHDETD